LLPADLGVAVDRQLAVDGADASLPAAVMNGVSNSTTEGPNKKQVHQLLCVWIRE
jgi:hypothetical protein